MAPPIEPPAHITLRIKVPPGHLEGGTDTFTLPDPVAVTTRIGGLRELIQTSLPSNPLPERQRLLYFGRALVDNDQTVADALNIRREPSQTEYVVHLLVRGVENATPAPRIATPPGQPVAPQQSFAQQYMQHEQQRLQQTMPHQHQNLPAQGLPEQFQPEVLLAQARLRQEQLQAELRMLQAQAQALNPRGPQTQPHAQGEQTATLPNVPSHQASPTALSQQTPSNAPSQQAQPNAPPLYGQPRTHNVFVQGVGPNGERISIHQQQRFFQHTHTHAHPNHMPPVAQGLPINALGMPPVVMQNQQNAQQPQTGSSSPALDRAREQIAELRRLLEEIRAENPPHQATQEQLARIARMEEQARSINSYIDPLNLATGHGNANQTVDPARQPPRFFPPDLAFNPRQNANNENQPPVNPTGQRFITPEQAANPRRQPHGESNYAATARYSTTGRLGLPRRTRVSPPANPEDFTCYLLSDPTGLPQALLLTPQHGTFTGTMQNNATTIANANPQAPQPQPAAAHAANLARVVQARRVPANGEMAAINPVGLLLRHFWLLLRIMIFSYFLLGSNMGWRRPLALGAIALGFWLMRAGMFGDGGVVRGWWDDIVREGAAAVEPARPAGAMPTPEEVARRLMEERRRGESEWVRWGRERVRAVVLLLASLWPGVGEAFVRAREAEERRLLEEEAAAEGRRREEEAARVAADEAEKNEGQAGGSAAPTAEQTSSDTQAASSTQDAAKSQAVASDLAGSGAASAGENQATATDERNDVGASTS